MALEIFVPKKFTPAHQHVIKQANAVFEEYAAQGFILTLRQLHYQFVARDWYANTQANYKRLGKIVDAARKAGLIDWNHIEDRTRQIRRIRVYDGPEDPMRAVADSFKLDPWDHQPVKRRIEVWIEKDALVGVIERVCNRFRLPYFSCRGYGSSSELYTAGKRLAWYKSEGYDVQVLHLGDHDPSGVQMSEDNEDRIGLFGQTEVPLHRLALNMDQIEKLAADGSPIPPNFAKQTDSRTKWYIDRFDTDDAWELDALKPKFIEDLITGHVEPLIDQKAWDATMALEQEHLDTFKEIISNWARTKAAPDMHRKLMEFAYDYSPSGQVDDDGYVNEDSETLDEFITESQRVLRKHGIGRG